MRDVYIKSGKKQKSRMSRDLVAQIHALDPPGRFLKRNAITNEWEEVADEYAREKCSQCLRDAVSEMKGMDASSASAATTSSAGDVASPVIFPPAPANNTTPTPPTREKQLAYSSVMSTPRASNLTTKKNVSTFAHSDDDDIPLMPPLISSDLPFQKRARTNTADDNVHAHTGSSDHDNNRDQEESRQEVDANSSPADQYNIPLFAAGGGDSDSSLPTASFDHCEQDFALFQEDDFLNDCMGSMDLGRVDDAPGTATEMTSTTKDDPSYEFCTEFF